MHAVATTLHSHQAQRPDPVHPPLTHTVEPRDPATFVAVTGVLLAVGLSATLVPAIRATRMDPVEALRED